MDRVTQLQQARVRAKEAGFTLVELAIVLVIIGLIVGGVLVGQDLIKAAEIRATTSDIERYNAAANTFRNKYNGLPGDIRAARAAQFGLTVRSATPVGGNTAGQGDGNGLIEGCSAAATLLGCESSLFWRDLTDAQLISQAYTVATDALVTAASIDAITTYLPGTPLRDNSFIHVFPQAGRNYYAIASYSGVEAGVQTFSTAGGQALSSFEAGQIDDKIDDGSPVTGIVRAINGFTAATGATVPAPDDAGPTVCVVSAVPGPPAAIPISYNVEDAENAASLNCSISIRTSF